MELRQWQKECLDDFIKARNRNESIFVFEACPGAGKSMMAAELSWQMLNDEENRIDVVIVVVPWTTIQGDESSGMIKTFDRRGLLTRDRLMIRGARIVSQPVPNRDAIITTYAEAMCQEGLETIKLWISKGLKIAVIFDEIHHANEVNGSWGTYAEQIQPLTEMTVVMSGTFFRTDGHPIKFVRYNDDNHPILSTPAYNYTRGVMDRVVRPVSCRFTDVEIRGVDEVEGLVTNSLFSIAANDRKFGKVMREVFHPEGECVRKMIYDLHDHMKLTRQRFPNAGALITCRPGRTAGSEDKHVHQIAQKIKQYTGQETVVVTHSDRNAQGKIDAFRNGTSPYLVAVNMVSEGVDIPRLRSVAFMRYVASEMMFRQIVGRILRCTDDEDGTAAMAFMPKFQLMHAFAVNMQNEALQGMRDLRCDTCGQYPCICACSICGQYPCKCEGGEGGSKRVKPDFEVLDVNPFDAGGSISDQEVHEAMRVIARAVMQKSVFHRHANDIQLANALSLGFPMMTAASDQTADKPLTQLERLNNARRRVNRLMQRIAGKLYDGNFQQCWVEELMKPYRADWTTVKNTWTLFQIEELAEKLEARLVEAFKNGN